jgi:hypothetical protein
MMNKKVAKVDPPPNEETISTRAEQKQVEEPQAIGAIDEVRCKRRRLHSLALAWTLSFPTPTMPDGQRLLVGTELSGRRLGEGLSDW